MSNVTLIMTRKPLAEVNYGEKNGRWGSMIVVKGGKVLSGVSTNIINPPSSLGWGIGTIPTVQQMAGIANLSASVLAAGLATSVGLGEGFFTVGFTGVWLKTFGGDVEVVARFDTLERFRTKSGKGYYVQLKPRPNKPYEIRMDISRNVKGYIDDEGEEHKGVNKTGQCLRVHGHDTRNSNGGAAGILLHEAPHPGWLKGCIAPRELNNRIAGQEPGPSRGAMETIFRLMGGFSSGKKAELLVMDW
jgi:hypothetical protein